MKKIYTKLYAIALTIFCFFASFSQAGAQSLAQQGDEAYMTEKYEDAIRLYKESIATDGSSSLIYYNLGNAYYRQDSLAQAILSYERALMLDPTNSDARTNLEFVNTKIIDVPSDNTSNSVLFIQNTMKIMTANQWATVSIVLFIILLVLVGIYIFNNNARVRKICFFSAIGMLLVTIASIAITIAVNKQMTKHDRAVIVAESSQLSTSPATPANNSQQAFLLHSGSVVTVLDSVATPLDPRTKMWYEVEVDGEHRAWIDAKDIEII